MVRESEEVAEQQVRVYKSLAYGAGRSTSGACLRLTPRVRAVLAAAGDEAAVAPDCADRGLDDCLHGGEGSPPPITLTYKADKKSLRSGKLRK